MVLDITLFIVVPTVAVTVATILARRSRPARSSEDDVDSISFIGGVPNTLFAVMFAFYVVFAWQNGDDIRDGADAEANALVDTYWQAGVAPQQDANRIRELLKNYAAEVADREWAMLDSGKTDHRVPEILNQIRVEATNLPTDAEPLASARDQILQNVRDIDENHRLRVEKATEADTFIVSLFVGTVICAVLMLVFPLIIGFGPGRDNVAAMVLLTIILGCAIAVSLQLMHPLHGLFGTGPDAFRDALKEMSGVGGG